MNKTLKTIWNIISTVIVVIVVLLAVLLVGVRLFGITTYAVISGSMEPVYPTGSLLYVKPTDPEDLKVGDSITFLIDEDTVATHRIVEILPDDDDGIIRFRTKGDANEEADGSPVHQNNIIGKPMFAIPYLGYFANFIQNPPGLYLAIGAAAVLVILVFLPDLLKDDKDNKKDDKKEENKEEDNKPNKTEDKPQENAVSSNSASNAEEGAETPQESGENS